MCSRRGGCGAGIWARQYFQWFCLFLFCFSASAVLNVDWVLCVAASIATLVIVSSKSMCQLVCLFFDACPCEFVFPTPT